tara:strand:- start:258 stop:608 length:351 start_codon:yes stop_codon:yes gene_type:complete
MGLKTDILKAFEKNLTHIEIIDGKSETVRPPTDEFSKLDILATDLMLAIKDFIQAQTFTVTKLNASQVGVPSTPAAVPIVTVKVDENNQAVDNPASGLESMNSKVKLKNIKKGSDS